MLFFTKVIEFIGLKLFISMRAHASIERVVVIVHCKLRVQLVSGIQLRHVGCLAAHGVHFSAFLLALEIFGAPLLYHCWLPLSHRLRLGHHLILFLPAANEVLKPATPCVLLPQSQLSLHSSFNLELSLLILHLNLLLSLKQVEVFLAEQQLAISLIS